jgi:hypothetical protein
MTPARRLAKQQPVRKDANPAYRFSSRRHDNSPVSDWGAHEVLRFDDAGRREVTPHEAEQDAIGEITRLRGQGRPLRAIADAVKAKGVKISHEGVARVLKAQRG